MKLNGISRFWQDVRYGSRMLRRSPGFAAVIVLTLALGIGVNTAIFSVVNAVLLRPLPYPEPDRLVQIKDEFQPRGGQGTQQTDWLRFNEVEALTREARLPVRAGAYVSLEANLAHGDEAERVNCGGVSASFLGVLGVRLLTGRDFRPEEDRPGVRPVVILGHGLWQRRFGADPGIVGRTVRLNQSDCPIVGVLPANALLPEPYDLLLPLAASREAGDEDHLGFPRAIGRLNPGAGLVPAQAGLDAVFQTVHDPKDRGRIVLAGLHADLVRGVRRQVLLLLGAVGLVLLIACANVANLLLARAASRQPEITIRSALGAGRPRLVRQLLTESALLAFIGGLLGLLLAFWTLQALRPWLAELLTVQAVGIDGRVLGFVFLATLGTALLFGMAPAFEATRTSLGDALKSGGRSLTPGRRQGRLSQVLVVSEIALAVVLVLGAGLLVNSFLRLRGVDPGFRPDRVLSFTVDLSRRDYPDARSQAAYFEPVIERLRALPGVEAVGANSMLPVTQAGTLHIALDTEDRPSPAGQPPAGRLIAPGETLVGDAVVNGDYFRALSIPLLRGRSFTDQDRIGAPRVAIVSAGVVRHFFPQEDPLGKRVRNRFIGGEWLTIVGVVGDVIEYDLEQESLPQVYECYLQSGRSLMSFAVKTTGDPGPLADAVRDAARSIDPRQPVYSLMTFEQRLAHTLASRRSYLMLWGAFALLALGLAAVGVYGVVSCAVAQRTHEIGVRMALGASRASVLAQVLKQGAILAGAGVGLGLLAGTALTRVVASELYGIPATDPLTFGGVAVVLIGVALAACWFPARRATRIDPMVALRCE